MPGSNEYSTWFFDTEEIIPEQTPSTQPASNVQKSVQTPVQKTFDPNAGRQDAYDTRWKNYLAELGKSKNRININKAKKYFDSQFEQDWNNEAASRNVDFALNQAKQKQNDIIGKFRAQREEAARLSQEQDALDYEAAGYTYDAATGNWNKPVTPVQPVAPVLKPKTDWNAVAVSALGEGNNMETVSKLQEELYNAGYNITIDGKFGNETRAAYEDYMNSLSYKKPSQLTTPVTPTPQNTNVFTSDFYNAAGQQFTLGKVNSKEEFDEAYSKFAGKRKGFWSGGSWATGRAWDKARDEMYNNYLKFYGLSSLQLGGRINKHQQGGTMGNQEELQKAFMAFLIEDAAAQGMQIQSEQDLQAYAQQLGEEGLKAKYQEFMQKMQGGVKAALGAKLNYINKLKGNCPEGEELIYMKKGGRMCPVCQKKAEKAEDGKKLQKKNAISDFKDKRNKINPNDTVNTKFGPRDLNGKTRYPKYDATKENYDYETRKRVQEKDEKSGKKVIGSACGSKMKKK